MSAVVALQSDLDALAARVAKLEQATPAVKAPPQAVAAGFNQLIFQDEFQAAPDIGFGTTNHKWNAGLWYEQIPAASAFTWDGKDILSLHGPCTLTTLYHDTSGGISFQNGYFEGRMRCSNWSALWLLSTAHAQNKAGMCSEIDIIETDQSKPNSAWTTLHRNTGGADTWNQGSGDNQYHELSSSGIIGQWHKFGCLWTPSGLSFYIDDVLVSKVPLYDSTEQPMFLILDCWAGGILGSPAVPPILLDVDWVRVWH